MATYDRKQLEGMTPAELRSAAEAVGVKPTDVAGATDKHSAVIDLVLQRQTTNNWDFLNEPPVDENLIQGVLRRVREMIAESLNPGQPAFELIQSVIQTAISHRIANKDLMDAAEVDAAITARLANLPAPATDGGVTEARVKELVVEAIMAFATKLDERLNAIETAKTTADTTDDAAAKVSLSQLLNMKPGQAVKALFK